MGSVCSPHTLDGVWDAVADQTAASVAHALAPQGHRVRRAWRWREVLRVGRLVIRFRRRVV